jgi:hypothetical protein
MPLGDQTNLGIGRCLGRIYSLSAVKSIFPVRAVIPRICCTSCDLVSKENFTRPGSSDLDFLPLTRSFPFPSQSFCSIQYVNPSHGGYELLFWLPFNQSVSVRQLVLFLNPLQQQCLQSSWPYTLPKHLLAQIEPGNMRRNLNEIWGVERTKNK